MVGESLGNWRIIRPLGSGGMGVVYQAEHVLIGRLSAVKVLRKDLGWSKDTVGRFFNEARATASIRHSGLVDVLDYGTAADGSAYLVMEYLEGDSLSAWLEAGGLPFELAMATARQIASAVGAAHAKGIIHRDLKPDNVLLIADDVAGGLRAKVLDFGIAKLFGEAQVGMVKTQTGSTMGTPLYMSPEQCRGAADIDARADVYSLGCILYEMVTGRLPFDGESPGDVMAAHLRDVPAQPSAHVYGLPPALEALILRMLQKKAAARPQSMAEVIGALDQLGARLHIPALPGRVVPRPAPVIPAAMSEHPAPPAPHPSFAEPTPPPTTPPPAVSGATPTAIVSAADLRRTTFGTSAGESLARPPRRRRWPIAAALGGVATIVILVVALRGHDQDDGHKQAPAAARPTPDVTPPAPAKPMLPPATPAPAPTPAVAAAPPALAATPPAPTPATPPVAVTPASVPTPVATAPDVKPPFRAKPHPAKRHKPAAVDFEDGTVDPFKK